MSAQVAEGPQPQPGEGSLDRGGGPACHPTCAAIWPTAMDADSRALTGQDREAMQGAMAQSPEPQDQEDRLERRGRVAPLHIPQADRQQVG